MNNPVAGINLTYLDSGESALEVSTNDSSVYTINPGTYKLNGFNEDLELYLGGVYTVLVSLDNTGEIQVCLHYKSLSLSKSRFQDVELYQITAPNSVHMLWLIPQYVVITAGEIMFSITGLEFSYSQAPVSMKSVLTAAFLLTTAVGNLIIVIIESAKIFEKQVDPEAY